MTIECKHHDYFKQPINLVLSIKVTQHLKDTSDNCTLYEKMQVTWNSTDEPDNLSWLKSAALLKNKGGEYS